MGLVGQPISHHPGIFVTKYDDIFDQEEVLIILSTLKAPFYFFRKFWSFGEFQKCLSEPKKCKICAKYAQICAILKKRKYAQNMRKFAEI
jgi:hypothetical protein